MACWVPNNFLFFKIFRVELLFWGGFGNWDKNCGAIRKRSKGASDVGVVQGDRGFAWRQDKGVDGFNRDRSRHDKKVVT